MFDIWIWVQQREGRIEAPFFGLTAEARRLISELGAQGRVTAVAVGTVPESELRALGGYGVDRVLHLTGDRMERYNGEYFARALFHAVAAEKPTCFMAARTAEIDDLFSRLAPLLNTVLVTRAMDFHMDPEGQARAVRPIANGYLFEEVALEWDVPPLVSFLPAVLFDTEPDAQKDAEVIQLAPEVSQEDLRTEVAQVIAAAPEDMDLEEADIIVAGGRGAGKGENFEIVHALARALGGSVGATRPIIDWGDLPYERQIGQTGKYVAPRLIVNCGISGANEYTAGMEKAHKVIAIDVNPRARIFRFADLGIVGDVHDILPQVISRIEEMKK